MKDPLVRIGLRGVFLSIAISHLLQDFEVFLMFITLILLII